MTISHPSSRRRLTGGSLVLPAMQSVVLVLLLWTILSVGDAFAPTNIMSQRGRYYIHRASRLPFISAASQSQYQHHDRQDTASSTSPIVLRHHVPPSSTDSGNVIAEKEKDVLNVLWHSCRSIFAVLFAILVWNTAPMSTDVSHFFLPGGAVPPSAWASSQVVLEEPRTTTTTTAAAAESEINVLQEGALPEAEGILSPTDGLVSEQPTILEPIKLTQETTVLDEAWTLVDKYYIDRSFNGLDWNKVRETYKAREPKNYNDEKEMKLVTDMVKSLGDKYSRVLDSKAYAAIQKFDLIGVGVTLMPNADKNIIVGAPPVPGSASDKAGLQSGDFITAVNGVPTEGRTAFDIIDQISENPNAEIVTMTVRTQGPNDLPGEGLTRDLTMDRTYLEVKNPVQYKISETRKDGTKVGYIRVEEFNSLVKAKLEDAIAYLNKEGANALVLDLRGNPGGAFQSAVEISSLFFENRVATNVVDSNLVELPFKTAAGRVMVDLKEPIAIWVDGGSASASEVFAGSLHDNCRAIVMGDKSFGKGLIQAVYGLKNGAGLVLTVAKYVTPKGTEIQGNGITPDIPGKVPPNLPGFRTDTSQVDFADIAQRLDPSMCKAPSS